MNYSENPALNAVLQKVAVDNPKMQLLAQLMQQQQQEAPSSNSKERNKEGKFQKLLSINQTLKKKLSKFKRQNQTLLSYLDHFIEINSVFSSAVGACKCWGEDHECEKCGGQGKPGYYEVEQEAFMTLVEPCIQKQESAISAAHQTEISSS